MKHLFLALVFWAALASPASAQQMRARELFYKETAAPPAQPKKKTPSQKTPPVPASPPTFGLKYKILRSSGQSGFEEAGASENFRNGDRLRVAVEANADSYLYIAAKGTSGKWEVLFPNATAEGGDNHVKRLKATMVNFSVEGAPGEEKLFLILSRQPETNLDAIIYKLSGGASAGPRLIAGRIGAIDDGLISRVRNEVRARDLVFESVNDRTPGERKEKAGYVVNTSSSPDSRVYADIVVKHR